MVMGPVIYHVDDKTNIHVALSPDKHSVALTTIVEGRPMVTICYAVDEALVFNWLILSTLNKIEDHR